MAAGDASLNTANHTALEELLKVKYGPAVPHLITQSNPFMKRMKKMKGFSKSFGGRQYEFPYELKRGMNTGVRAQGAYLPGFGGVTNDDLDTISAETAVIDRARIYDGVSFDGMWLQKDNDQYGFKPGQRFASQMKYMMEDTQRTLLHYLFGDQTGYLGTVLSVSTVTVNLYPVTTVDVRGVAGTQRILPNMKLWLIPSAHWSTSPTASKADSDQIIKVSSVSDLHDTTATPSFVATVDVSGFLSAGDVLVPAYSRSGASSGAGSGGTLFGFQGFFNWIDDATLTSDLYGLSRSSFPILNAKTDLSTTSRKLTWKMMQSLVSNLDRRVGNAETKNHIFLSEMGVRDAYVPDEAAPLKRYNQEDKALKVVSGFDDVCFAFLGQGRAVPWVTDRDFPYGHAMYLDLNDTYAMWEKQPGIMNEDGLDMRQSTGKDEWYVMLSGYGQFMMKEPYKCARLSGLEGAF